MLFISTNGTFRAVTMCIIIETWVTTRSQFDVRAMNSFSE